MLRCETKGSSPTRKRVRIRPISWVREPSMSSFARVFDPLDLEIIDRVVEAVWVRIEAQSSLRDGRTDDELKEMLLKQVMICAASGKVDFDALYDKVAASMS